MQIHRRLNDIKLLGTKILLAKCREPAIEDANGNVLLHLPTSEKERCRWGKILNVGEDCREYSDENIGDLVEAPYWEPGFHKLPSTWGGGKATIWILDEKLIKDTSSLLEGFVIGD